MFLPELAALHLGPLHGYERAMVYLLAFGPVLLLVFTVWWSGRDHPDGDQHPPE